MNVYVRMLIMNSVVLKPKYLNIVKHYIEIKKKIVKKVTTIQSIIIKNGLFSFLKYLYYINFKK
jgi:hypothetical protein